MSTPKGETYIYYWQGTRYLPLMGNQMSTPDGEPDIYH